MALELIGVEVGELDAVEAGHLQEYLRHIEGVANLDRRKRSMDTHLDDGLIVLRKQRLEAAGPSSGAVGSSAVRSVLPLPGMRAGKRRLRAAAAQRATGLAQADAVMRDRWNTRLESVLVQADAVSVRDCEGSEDLRTTVRALVGRARPATVRLRVRAWEAFARWLALRRGGV